MRVEVEVEQRVHLRVDDQDDAAAAAAVAAVGAAERLELLAVDRGAAVTAVARAGVNDDAVDEPGHRSVLSIVECAFTARNRGLNLAEMSHSRGDLLRSRRGRC